MKSLLRKLAGCSTPGCDRWASMFGNCMECARRKMFPPEQPPEDRCTNQLKWVYNGRDDCEPVLQQLWMVWDHDKKTITPEWRRVPEFEEAQQ